MKVLFINNYPMDIAWRLWREGKNPGHHLWGVTELSKYGIDVDILPHEVFKLLRELMRSFGNLDEQVRVILRYLSYDLVYSGCKSNTRLLAYLRHIGVYRKPIVAIVHRPISFGGKRNKIYLQGHDKLICLSKSVMKQISASYPGPAKDKDKLTVLPWGPDLNYYEDNQQNLTKDSRYVISAGKTHRDHDTLVKAFSELDCSLRLYCSPNTLPSFSPIPSGVIVYPGDDTHPRISDRKVFLQEFQGAFAVAIPLKFPDRLFGLTSLLDAMAMGKPVVMTRVSQFDIDIEREGFGIWVDVNDVQGWRKAISYFLNNPDEAVKMGKRARVLCEQKYNIQLYAAQLASLLKEVVAQTKRRHLQAPAN